MKKRFISEQVLFAIGGFMMGTLLVGIGALITYLAGAISWEEGTSFEPGDLVFGLLLMFLLATIEEYIFRRLLLRRLIKSLNPWLALFISSVLFAAVHLMNKNISPLAIVNVFMGGLVFGIAYMYIRSIVFVIFFHFAWNFVQGPVIGFAVSGLPFESIFTPSITANNLINGGAFGFEGSIICSAVLFVTFVVFVILIEK